jgi:hypothetical protein
MNLVRRAHLRIAEFVHTHPAALVVLMMSPEIVRFINTPTIGGVVAFATVTPMLAWVVFRTSIFGVGPSRPGGRSTC